ncbi:MAG: hypothetical protein RIM83_16240 [Allomuricauda sp.]
MIAKMILGCSNSLFQNFIHLFYEIFVMLYKGKKEILKMYRAIPVTAPFMFLFISSFARAYFTTYPIGTILEISILLSVLAGIEKLGPNINQYSCKVGVCGVGGYITKTINKPPRKFELFVHPDKGRTKTNLPPMATHFK